MRLKIKKILKILPAIILLTACNYNDAKDEKAATPKCSHHLVGYDTDELGSVKVKCSICGDMLGTYGALSFYQAPAKNYKNKILDSIKLNLKDPDSLLSNGNVKFYKMAKNGELETKLAYKINYNAKNSFGGYVGYKTVYYLLTYNIYTDYGTYATTSLSIYEESFDFYGRYSLYEW